MSQDFFLHRTASNLFLDNISPSSPTFSFTDSPFLTRAGGNQFKLIGIWGAGTPTSNCTLTALSDLHIWVGLKNSDDFGTKFDIKAEVVKNLGQPPPFEDVIATGIAQCVSGVTRNPAQAKQVVIAFPDLSVPRTFDQESDELSLRLSAAIGSGVGCTGHAGALGLRLYYDASNRNSRFDVTLELGCG